VAYILETFHSTTSTGSLGTAIKTTGQINLEMLQIYFKFCKMSCLGWGRTVPKHQFTLHYIGAVTQVE
jgi:hypothetical protein